MPRQHRSSESSSKPRGKRRSQSRKGGGGSGNRGSGIAEITVIEILEIDENGELIAAPATWEQKNRVPPIIHVETTQKRDALGVGDRALARLKKIAPHTYSASIIKKLPAATPQRILGHFRLGERHGVIEPISRKVKEYYKVAIKDSMDAQSGELVEAEIISAPGASFSARAARIVERLGDTRAPRAASMIAIHTHDIPHQFPPEAIAQAEAFSSPAADAGRNDLREIPLITIDGEDARDFDDAVFAEPDSDRKNPGGWHVVVAIADVAHYVQPGSALDHEAFRRGNSVYFPDRVVPMLPEALSNELCSLKPEVDRYCLAVHLWIDAEGNTRRAQFVRGVMRSVARTTYTQVQQIQNATQTHALKPLIAPLYGAYGALNRQRARRGALDLDLPEYKIMFDNTGAVADIVKRERLDSHRLIEELMIAANVAAAHVLDARERKGIFRVHDRPDATKLKDARAFLERLGYGLSKGDGITAHHFNSVIRRAEGKPETHVVSQVVLRSQMQAIYSHENAGHFGLGLEKYCHFTSPIRRYADTIVHRALISVLKLTGHEKDGLTNEEFHRLPAIAEHISATERRAMMAERDTQDRYIVSFMEKKIGQEFSGVITGINKFGLFVTLADTGATGFVPIGSLQQDFFRYDERHASFIGRSSGMRYEMGQKLWIRVRDTNTLTGSMTFDVLQAEKNLIRHRPAPKKKGKAVEPAPSRGQPKPGGKKRKGKNSRRK